MLRAHTAGHMHVFVAAVIHSLAEAHPGHKKCQQKTNNNRQYYSHQLTSFTAHNNPDTTLWQ
jgi:hypothetical protein